MVRKGGLEPPHPYGHKNLNLNNLFLLRFAEVSGDRLSQTFLGFRCRVSSIRFYTSARLEEIGKLDVDRISS